MPREGGGSAERNKRKSRSEKSKGMEKDMEKESTEKTRDGKGDARAKVQTFVLKVREKEGRRRARKDVSSKTEVQLGEIARIWKSLVSSETPESGLDGRP